MVYVISQTKGPLADDARRMWEHTCKEPNEEAAKALLAKHEPEHVCLGSSFTWVNREGVTEVCCWWRYNAPSVISHKIELPEKLLDKIYNWCFSHGHTYDGRAERWIVSELNKRFPDCVWDIHYEY